MSLFVFQGCCNTYAQAANRRKRGKARYASLCSHRGAGSEEWHDMPRAAPQFKSVPLRKGSPVSTSFLFVFDTEWVMSIREHQGRDTLLQTGLKIHWSRRSASSCFNRAWRVTKSSAKHQSLLSPWVMQHQPWPWPQSIPLYFLLLILDRTDVCSPLLCLFPTQFCAKSTCRAKKRPIV